MTRKAGGKPSTDATKCLNCGKLQREMDAFAMTASKAHDALQLDLIKQSQTTDELFKLALVLIENVGYIIGPAVPMDQPLAMAMSERASRINIDARNRLDMILPGWRKHGTRNTTVPTVRQ